MLFLINDYVLPVTARAKLFLWAGEIAVQPPGGELGATFSVTGDSGGSREVPSGTGVDIKRIQSANATAPISAAELDLNTLGPGNVRVEARVGDRTVGSHELLAVSVTQHAELMRNVRDEKLRRREATADAAAQGAIWLHSWERLFVYLDAPVPRHVGFRMNAFPSSAGPVPPDACDFIAFHICRFLFDQLIYGGTVVVGPTPPDTRPGTRLTVTSRAFPPARGLPDWLTALFASLTADGVRVVADWRVDSPATPTGGGRGSVGVGPPASATLDVFW